MENANKRKNLLNPQERWLNIALAHYKARLYKEALEACTKALQIDSNYVRAHLGKGLIFNNLKRYDEALLAFERVLGLDSVNIKAYYGKGKALYELKRYEEALAVFNQLLELDPQHAEASYDKRKTLLEIGKALYASHQYIEALATCVHATEFAAIDEENCSRGERRTLYQLGSIFYELGGTLFNLKRYEEALTAYEYAIQIKYSPMQACYGKGMILRALHRDEEAKAAFRKSSSYSNAPMASL